MELELQIPRTASAGNSTPTSDENEMKMNKTSRASKCLTNLTIVLVQGQWRSSALTHPQTIPSHLQKLLPRNEIRRSSPEMSGAPFAMEGIGSYPEQQWENVGQYGTRMIIQ